MQESNICITREQICDLSYLYKRLLLLYNNDKTETDKQFYEKLKFHGSHIDHIMYCMINYRYMNFTSDDIYKYIELFDYFKYDFKYTFCDYIIQKIILKSHSNLDRIIMFTYVDKYINELCNSDYHMTHKDISYITENCDIIMFDTKNKIFNNDIIDKIKSVTLLTVHSNDDIKIHIHKFDNLAELRFKYLSDLQITDLLEQSKKLPNFVKLDLSYCFMSGPYSEYFSNIRYSHIRDFINLSYLDISNNIGLKDIDIMGLINLHTLIAENTLKFSSDVFINLKNLRILHYTYLQNDALDYLQNLTDLHISDNNYITDEGLIKLKKLQILDTQGTTRITYKGIEHMENLMELYLYEIHVPQKIIKKFKKLHTSDSPYFNH